MTETVQTEDTFERAQFELFMERHVAQLLDFAKPYIGRMVPEQREAFLALALDQAWEQRAALKPRKNQYGGTTVNILRWWEDKCLRPAARSRKEWKLRTWDRRFEYVPGHRLGKEQA